MRMLLLSLITTIIVAVGQVLWKMGMDGRELKSFSHLINAFFSPLILTGIVLYFLATLLWLYILSKTELSSVYPIQALSYVFVLIVSFFLFKEDVSIKSWFGVVIICFGVYLATVK